MHDLRTCEMHSNRTSLVDTTPAEHNGALTNSHWDRCDKIRTIRCKHGLIQYPFRRTLHDLHAFLWTYEHAPVWTGLETGIPGWRCQPRRRRGKHLSSTGITLCTDPPVNTALQATTNVSRTDCSELKYMPEGVHHNVIEGVGSGAFVFWWLNLVNILSVIQSHC